MYRATLDVDGEVIIDRGRHLLYEEPEVIKIAEK